MPNADKHVVILILSPVNAFTSGPDYAPPLYLPKWEIAYSSGERYKGNSPLVSAIRRVELIRIEAAAIGAIPLKVRIHQRHNEVRIGKRGARLIRGYLAIDQPLTFQQSGVQMRSFPFC